MCPKKVHNVFNVTSIVLQQRRLRNCLNKALKYNIALVFQIGNYFNDMIIKIKQCAMQVNSPFTNGTSICINCIIVDFTQA